MAGHNYNTLGTYGGSQPSFKNDSYNFGNIASQPNRNIGNSMSDFEPYNQMDGYATSPTQILNAGKNFNWSLEGIGQAFKDRANQPFFAQPILKDGVPTGQTSGSIMGDLGSLGSGLLDIGKLGMGWWSANEASKAMKENKKLNRAQMQFGLDAYNDRKISQEAQRIANTGVSGQQAYATASASTPMKSLASYGLK